jgi:D-glycero-D-manno-heptose 1,7-bisphosphate phosphatase
MKRPAVFFDRDNTLVEGNGYIGDPAEVKLVAGAAAAVARARRLGYATVIVSNQSGVARGMFDEAAVHAVNQRLEQLLLADDPAAVIDRHEFCPFLPDAPLEAYRQDSELRKPKPGMILQAAEMLALDLSRSWMIGDAPRDVTAGRLAGCRTILFTAPGLASSPAAADENGSVGADFTVDSLAAAMDVIEKNPEPATAQQGAARSQFATESFAGEAGDQGEEEEDRQEASGGRGSTPAAPTVVAAPSIRAEKSPPGIRSAASRSAVEQTPARPQQQQQQRSEALLEQILVELRRRDDAGDDDFSVSKLLAGIVQVLAIGVIFLAYLHRTQDDFAALMLFGLFLQMLVVALLIMGKQR